MKKKVIIISSIACIGVLAGLKINNFLIGQKILGSDTSIKSDFLKILPIKMNIKDTKVHRGITASLAGIKFIIPKIDTFRTFRLRERYCAFHFLDSAQLKVQKDSSDVDFLDILNSPSDANYNIIRSYLKDNNISSNFDLLLFSYFKSPDDISFFNLSRENTIIQYSFLKFKDLTEAGNTKNGLYYFTLAHIKGFQYGRPGSSVPTVLRIYTNDNEGYLFVFTKFNQEQIDQVITSINDN